MAYLKGDFLDELNLQPGDQIGYQPSTSGTHERTGVYQGHTPSHLTFVNNLSGMSEVVPFERISRKGVRIIYREELSDRVESP